MRQQATLAVPANMHPMLPEAVVLFCTESADIQPFHLNVQLLGLSGREAWLDSQMQGPYLELKGNFLEDDLDTQC